MSQTESVTAEKPIHRTTMERSELYDSSGYWFVVGLIMAVAGTFLALVHYFGEPVAFGFLVLGSGAAFMYFGNIQRVTGGIAFEAVYFGIGLALILLGIIGPAAFIFGKNLALAIGIPLAGLALMALSWRMRTLATRPRA